MFACLPEVPMCTCVTFLGVSRRWVLSVMEVAVSRFPDSKKCVMRKSLSIFLSALLVLGSVPTRAIAEVADELASTDGLAAIDATDEIDDAGEGMPQSEDPEGQDGTEPTDGAEEPAADEEPEPDPEGGESPDSGDDDADGGLLAEDEPAPEGDGLPDGAEEVIEFEPRTLAVDDANTRALKDLAASGEAIVQAACNGSHSAAITATGDLYIWGSHFLGMIGEGTATPTWVMGDVAQVAIGLNDAAAITKSGDLYMWGYNYWGQLGDGTTEDKRSPTWVMGDVASVRLSDRQTAAVTTSGDLYMWGENYCGQLGDGTTEERHAPTFVMGDVAQVSALENTMAAITTSGDLYMWGNNRFGQIGDGTTEERHAPTWVMADVAQVDVAGYTTAAVTTSGDLYAWGDNTWGQIGDGTRKSKHVPTWVMGDVVQVDGSGTDTAAVTTSGDLYTWGFIASDANTNEFVVTPTLVMGDVTRVVRGGSCTAAITASGDLYMWGGNNYGQLGDGTTEFKCSPTLVMGEVDQVLVSSSFHNAVITTSKDLYLWGSNSVGQVGDGTTRERHIPVWIAGPNPPGQDAPFRKGVRSLTFPAKGTASTEVEWDDDWFSQGGHGGYNHGLAIASAALSAAAYSEDCLVEDLGTLGFEVNPGQVYYGTNYIESDDPVAFALGRKTLADGTPLIAVVIRGSDTDEEWASNFNIDDDGRVGGRYHDGFESAAQDVLGRLRDYCDSLGVDYATARFLVTGHSRAGAVGNLVAAHLDEDAFGTGIRAENVYAYTFASPATASEGDAGGDGFGNIYNVVNPEDLVPLVPLTKWGYARYGVDLLLPSLSSFPRDDYRALYLRMNGAFSRYRGVNFVNYPGGTRVADSFSADAYHLAPTVRRAYGNGVYGTASFIDTLRAIMTKKALGSALGGLYVGYLKASFWHALDSGSPLRLYLKRAKTAVLASETVLSLLEDGNSFGTEVGHAHDCVAYLSWLQSSEDGVDIYGAMPFTRVAFAVDALTGSVSSTVAEVRVLDAAGAAVCVIRGQEVERVDDSAPAVTVDGGVVSIDVPEGDSYRIDVSGGGSMRVSAAECGPDGSVGQVASYQVDDLSEGACTATIDGGSDADGVAVEQEGSSVEPSHVSTSADDTVQITLEAGEDGDAWGGGEVRLGDIVTVHALPADDGHYFAGWYAGEELVSAEPDHAVLAASDVSLRAEFAPKTSVADDAVSVEVADGSVYSGEAVEPAVLVTHGDAVLAQGVDYDLSFTGNVEAGDAIVTVEGIGRYMGTRDATFHIDKAVQTIAASNKTVAMGKTVNLEAKTSGEGILTYKSSNTAVAKVSATGVVTPVKVGTVKITISVTGDANHEPATKTVTVTVTKGTQSITASNKTVAAGGTVSLGAKASGGGKLTYKSSNTKVATVDSKGVVTGRGVGTATITVTAAATPNYNAATRKVTVTVTAAPSVSYRTHVQNVGWQAYVKDGAMSGTSGSALRLEGINIKLGGAPYSGSIEYRTHVQNIGWQAYVKDGAMSGTSGKALRLEAIQIKLTGKMAEKYDVYYRVHCQNIGWMGWAKNGQSAGSAGYAYRLEGIQVVLVPKGKSAPSATYKGITANTKQRFSQR